MLNTFLQVLPLSLGGAVNPVGILIIFFIITGKNRPLKRAWSFLAGSTTFLILVIFAEYFLLKYTLGTARHQTSASALIDIAIGIFLILLAIFRKKQRVKSEKKRNLWGEFIYGFIFMIIDISTLVLYFAAIKIISEDKLALPQNIVLFTVNTIIVMSTMTLPVFLASVMPARSDIVLNPLKSFINKHGQLISKIVIVIIGLYLIYKGGNFFFI